MKSLNEDELFERLNRRWEDHKVTHAEIISPDYEAWGRAREWEYHQAVCLLAGMTPLSKPYFDILISDRSPFDFIHWITYYPFKPQDQNRLINIDRLIKTLIPNTKLPIQPKTLLAQCKSHIGIAQSIPEPLITVIEQFGRHPSLNLPNVFRSLELNPSVFINLSKIKENKEKPRLFAPTETPHPPTPPVPPKPTESPLLLSKRLYPLQRAERWIEADGLSLNEIILLYYGIDPEGIYQSHLPGEPIEEQAKEFIEYLNRYFYGDRQLLISQIDEKKIVDLIRRSIHVGNLKISNQGIFSSTEIVTWMQSKNLPFPIPEPGNRKASPPGSEDNLKQAILAYDMERLRPQQQGKLLCRIVASSLWKSDKSLKLPNILKHPRFKKAVLLAQEIMNKTDSIEPKTLEDWVRDINPNYNPKK
ncbi:MAG TPA: hypothetical protein DCE71_02740 [Parachlamydiales bacterium]|nr:hypothetical protein [Parachlamydiales bacterium]